MYLVLQISRLQRKLYFWPQAGKNVNLELKVEKEDLEKNLFLKRFGWFKNNKNILKEN